MTEPVHAGALSPTLSWLVLLHALLGTGLGVRVSLMRLRHRTHPTDPNKIDHAARVHANFAEWVPISLLVLAGAESLGLNVTAITFLGTLLFVSRALHAWGYSRNPGVSFGRRYGIILNFVVLALSLLACIIPGPWTQA